MELGHVRVRQALPASEGAAPLARRSAAFVLGDRATWGPSLNGHPMELALMVERLP